MRRLAVIAIAVLTVTAACGSDDSGGAIDNPDQPGSTVARSAVETVTPGKLTVCSDVPYAPFEYEVGGKVVGIDADLVRAIGDDLGLDAEFRDTDFDGIFAALEAGQCDLIASSVSITAERRKAHDFSQGYYEIHQSLLVRKGDETRYNTLDALKGKIVGVQSETTGAAFAKEQGEPKGVILKEFTGADELFTALKAKQVDGVLQDLPVNAYSAKTTGESVVSTIFDQGEAEQYGFVMKKGNAELVRAVDEALAAVKADGRYQSILDTYLDTAGASGGSTTSTTAG